VRIKTLQEEEEEKKKKMMMMMMMMTKNSRRQWGTRWREVRRKRTGARRSRKGEGGYMKKEKTKKMKKSRRK
jgi:hypothetical protein